MYNCDCMEMMEVGQWDLAIVDPPYGIDYCSNDNGKISRGKPQAASLNEYKLFNDTKRPDGKYFGDLLEITGEQLIFGAQHFTDLLPKSSKWIVWDKIPSGCGGQFSGIELIWTSFKGSIDRYNYKWQGMLQGNMSMKEKRIHPTQKPIQLYRLLLSNYATEGDTILDTHGGSMSLAIACWEEGFDLDICELDEDYFNDAVERFENHIAQTQLF